MDLGQGGKDAASRNLLQVMKLKRGSESCATMILIDACDKSALELVRL